MFVSKVKAGPHQNVIQLTLGAETAQRRLSVWIQKDKQIAITYHKYWNAFCCIAEQKWTKIEISQTLVDGKV